MLVYQRVYIIPQQNLVTNHQPTGLSLRNLRNLLAESRTCDRSRRHSVPGREKLKPYPKV